ncbi:MAG: hypothetical protein K0U47_06330 [Epsilonproteobacteria bacterium]|nr:hypothetical protein [Campylobacterota bacterium]
MKKIIAAIAVLGLGVSLQAGSVSCDFPVIKCEPVWKTVIKKVPKKECWDEEQKSAIDFKDSGSDICKSEGIVVAKKCTVTKCRTVYESHEEKVLVGYKNTAKCGCTTFSKISNRKLKFITTTINF